MTQLVTSMTALESDFNMMRQYLANNREARYNCPGGSPRCCAVGLRQGWIHGVERDIREMVRRAARSMLACFVEGVGTGDVGTHLDDAREWRRHGTHDLTYPRFRSGAHDARAYYHHDEQGGFCPLDAALALPERSYSYVLQGSGLEMDADISYRGTHNSLDRMLGVTMSKAMLEASRDVTAFWQQQGVPSGEGEVIVVEADAKGVNMARPADKQPGPKMRLKKGEKRNKKKMANLFTIQTLDPVAETEPTSLNRKTYGFLCSKREAFEQIVAEVQKRRVGRTRILFLSDGDPDLRDRPASSSRMPSIASTGSTWSRGSGRPLTCFSRRAARRRTRWVKTRQDWLMEGNVGKAIRGLKQSLTKSTRLTAAQRETLAKVIGYLEGVRDRVPYEDFYSAGLPISTGSMEGGCRHLVCDRMEGTGMHWKDPERRQCFTSGPSTSTTRPRHSKPFASRGNKTVCMAINPSPR